MEANRERSIEWGIKEGHTASAGSACWDSLALARFPSGLDYYVLDCVLVYGSDVCFHWLSLCLGSASVYRDSAAMVVAVERWLTQDSVEVLIEKLDQRRRRRLRLEREWETKREALMNRVLRVKKRALRLSEEETKDEIVGGSVGDARQRELPPC